MTTHCGNKLLAYAALLLFGGGLPLGAQAAAPQVNASTGVQPEASRITNAIDNKRLTTIAGTRSLKAQVATDQGAMPGTKSIRNMTLVLKRSPERQAKYNAYINELSNPSSPKYHKWLTAKQIGTMFGPTDADIKQVTNWLSSQGLKVDGVLPTGMMVRFSGTASTVNSAFHTQMHSFSLKGETHFANATDQQIPEALSPVVAGVSSLDNFFPRPLYHNVGVVTKDKKTGKWSQLANSPDYTVPPGTVITKTVYDVAPADFNKIYNVESLWGRATPIRGAGQTVAVLERTDVLPSDVVTFRSAFLPADAQGVVSYVNPQSPYTNVGLPTDTTCNDPGLNGDEGEAALDVEWIGAAAPDANIVFASCDDSNSPSFGPFTAALNLLNNPGVPPPTVFSLSYGECEVLSITNIVSYVGEVWQQAAAQGVTVYVSSGDAGSAGCDQNQSAAVFGINVNMMSATPFNVSVGGTDFDDFNKYSQYWTSTNMANGLSALGYIPEQTWNDSCASSKLDAVLKLSDRVTACNSSAGQRFMNTAGGSGGPSVLWSKPVWQTGIYGSANNAMRMQPDIALFAANGLYGHALVFCMSDPNVGGTACDYSNPDNVAFNSAGGTSFAAPAMAGIQALINQAAGQAHGIITPTLYDIASKEYGTTTAPNYAKMSACNSSNGTSVDSSCVFYDVTQGDIDEPCYAGSSSCYSGSGKNSFGVLSHGGDVSLAPAWQTNAGYDYATGLGSINAANLVDAVVAYDTPRKRGYASPEDFLSPTIPGVDGYSDIALVDPVAGVFTDVAMQGSFAVQVKTQTVGKGYTIGVIGAFYPHFDDPAGALASAGLPGYNYASIAWTGPDNQLYVWISNGVGGKGNYLSHAIGSPYASGWTLVGAGDFDGVGQDELLWRNDSTGQLEWWHLNLGLYFVRGGRQYHWSVDAPTPMTAASGYTPTVADVDGDGYADIIWTNPHDNSVYVWINNHAGDFVRHRVTDHQPGFVLYGAGDLNGDGKTDLIWTNPSTNQMSWWIMNGFNIVDQEVRNVQPGYTMSSIADYDGDGLADILWVGTAGDVYQWRSTGNGFQSFQVTDPTGAPFMIPAGAKVQANRLQGAATAGYTMP
ncbi:protease pro-enzyme activation domain-containing protein [Dyella humicola]|uniref:protease pro-enzyme activation domain-containing protein n=1 Tax=Dyella humicola TaxID=2992126 RepID=UPI0022560356|nr:protease pro-enzyme activation domain-containing protein [Dyella humicola]